MTKKIQLSHSAANKYDTCGAMYKYHYIDRIRPITSGSPLFFGSAVDEALNELLKPKMKDYIPKKGGKKKPELDVFRTEWNKQKENDKIEYFKSDIDLSLLNSQQKLVLETFDPEVEDHEQFLEECFAILKKKEKLCEEDQKLYNRIAWECLFNKGLMLLDEYEKNILPQIHTVFEIQKKIEIKDDKGNNIIGYIDAIVSFIDAPDRKVVLDNKTSSKKYADDSVVESPQLATYCEAEELDYGAYAVVEKAIRKREPRTRSQLIVDKVSEKTLDNTFEMYNNVLEGIQNEEFDKNYDSGCFFFGKPCPYFKYCKSNGKIMEGLEEV